MQLHCLYMKYDKYNMQEIIHIHALYTLYIPKLIYLYIYIVLIIQVLFELYREPAVRGTITPIMKPSSQLEKFPFTAEKKTGTGLGEL